MTEVFFLFLQRREIPNYGNQDFPPLNNGVYFMVIIKKNFLQNENSPITDPITKMGVAHAFEHCDNQSEIKKLY